MNTGPKIILIGFHNISLESMQFPTSRSHVLSQTCLCIIANNTITSVRIRVVESGNVTLSHGVRTQPAATEIEDNDEVSLMSDSDLGITPVVCYVFNEGNISVSDIDIAIILPCLQLTGSWRT